jgi:hypothetical protein
MHVEKAGDSGDQLARVYGFGQMHLVAGQKSALPVFGSRMGGQCNGHDILDFLVFSDAS